MNEEPDFVRNKIRASKGKTPAKVARARTSQAHVSTEKEQKFHDLLAPHLPDAAKAWVDGLKATKGMWNQATHSFEDSGLPDHKVRAECARAIFENVVGKPIERSMQVSGSYKELDELVIDLRKSPEAQRLIAAGFFQSLLSTAEGKDSGPMPENETKPDSGQKTG